MFILKKFEDLSDPPLMIFDNYDKPAEVPAIRDYLPRRSKIIFNSRHTDAKRLGKGIEVGAMTVEVSILRSAFSLVKCSSLVAKTRLSERIARVLDFSRCSAGWKIKLTYILAIGGCGIATTSI